MDLYYRMKKVRKIQLPLNDAFIPRFADSEPLAAWLPAPRAGPLLRLLIIGFMGDLCYRALIKIALCLGAARPFSLPCGPLTDQSGFRGINAYIKPRP